MSDVDCGEPSWSSRLFVPAELKELLTIVDEMASDIVSYDAYGQPMCHFCCAEIEKINSRGVEVTHESDCPILKLKQLKKKLITT